MTAALAATRPRPKQARAQATYDRLLDVAGLLLGDVGLEDITTNLICARAGVTPPALYRYFGDKHAVLAALGERLMARQNVVLEQWIARHEPAGPDALRANVEELLVETARVTAAEPGADWILRALHASPRLAPIRIASHRYVTDRLVDTYLRHVPCRDRDELWQRLRLAVEIGFAVDEMLREEDRIAPAPALRHAARMLNAAFAD